MLALAALAVGIATLAQHGEEYEPVAQASPAELDARQRVLRAQLRQMRWADMPAEQRRALEQSCAELYASVKRRAVAADGEPRRECPAPGRFIATCRELSPETARCLLPEVAASERERCREQFQREDREAALAMNHTLSRCYPMKVAAR